MFDDNKKKPTKNGKRLSSSSNNTESDGETGSIKDEQMVPNGLPKIRVANLEPIRSEFAFSDLMRRMASKYQDTPSDGSTNSEKQ